eukprot:CAMPEP_0196733682 /NCGR_PEP_ID=MMETSP1091-20130531/12634_1 /TAXON_ID=302021 /ORGANISM="Rhodomonas sp., Strain CCMP768" /LENGTH=192 /DNA_ID=CAMNT_0042077083 /DNA_START=296 /DNA_END=871 /DNA_ORIENTATION=-
MPPTYEEAQQALDNFVAAETKQLSDVLLFTISHMLARGWFGGCLPACTTLLATNLSRVDCSYKWGSLVHLLVHQLKSVLETPSEEFPIAGTVGLAGEASYEASCKRLYQVLGSFPGPPFTVQRLCELLTRPHAHHKTKQKLLFAVDKLLSVTSVVPEIPIAEMPPVQEEEPAAQPQQSGDAVMAGQEGAEGG